MGNRVYITLKSNHTSQTYYMHWNGGLDTWAPVCKVLFDNSVKDFSQVVDFVKSMDLRIEKQDSPEAINWIEENGHYTIDLDKQTLEQKFEERTVWHASLAEAFEQYLAKYIRPDCIESTRKQYWDGIIEAGEKFFKPLKPIVAVFCPGLESGTMRIKHYPDTIELQYSNEETEKIAKLAMKGQV